MNFAQFQIECADGGFMSGARSLWVREPGLRIYMRGPKFAQGADFTLSNISADKPGNGALTRWLDEYEPQFCFYIEQILERRFYLYFQRRGYRDAPGAGTRYAKSTPHMIGPHVTPQSPANRPLTERDNGN
jgi:hypothetical protein